MSVDPALVELIERTAEETRRHVDASLGVLRGEMSGLRDGLRGEIADVKRHSEVIAEDLRDRIQLVAEGVVATNERIDGLRSEMQEEFADVRAMIRVSYRDVDRRVTRLESGAG